MLPEHCFYLLLCTWAVNKHRWLCGLTLHWCDGGLREADVVFCDVVSRLVLGDLHARAHVALPVEEEGEGA